MTEQTQPHFTSQHSDVAWFEHPDVNLLSVVAPEQDFPSGLPLAASSVRPFFRAADLLDEQKFSKLHGAARRPQRHLRASFVRGRQAAVLVLSSLPYLFVF